MSNFRRYLSTLSPDAPLQVGRRLVYTRDPSQIYDSGGAGITLSRTALSWLGSNVSKDASLWAGPDNGVRAL